MVYTLAVEVLQYSQSSPSLQQFLLLKIRKKNSGSVSVHPEEYQKYYGVYMLGANLDRIPS